ncbi:peptidase U32 family protein [Candidatus Contubernalis alkaliaceticus]|uniref:peptidase U32 family protein n=1 Tax=Candidatus Contubernalis alkaliaceticus TaxID=338645 RepID=UPI001F4BF8B1|nr:U32 family peptidase [Candidatus Contubernalis alkalaceticus]UNC92798.1 U32 family peptidase [Candidatus Contubernalis alkalaceticus]
MYQKMELLAPVGRWDVLEAVIEEGADAVYLGAKKHNMRMFRSDFNFTEEEIEAAIKYARQRGVKVYITLNNLLFDQELEELKPYLRFLGKVKPDALIIQDLGVIKLMQELRVSLPLHASVMVNVHNEPAVKLLSELGVSRTILSRDISLAEAKQLLDKTGMELEYFIHGDMCLSQSGQCYHSGMVFGESSNRGKCMKTCRWAYSLWDRNQEAALSLPRDKKYLLAIKDMCMLNFIPELQESGICSLKIEGRMRTVDYLSKVVRIYRSALDRYYKDPLGYQMHHGEWKALHADRVRDFSSMYAFKNPGSTSIGYSGEREPRFFSYAVREKEITEKDIQQQVFSGQLERKKMFPNPKLAVRVGNIKGMIEAIKGGAHRVYIGGESFVSSGGGWSAADLYYAVNYCKTQGVEGVVTTPRVTQGRQMARVEELFAHLEKLKPSGIMAANLGTLYLALQFKNMTVYGDYSLNVINRWSAELLKKLGVKQLTLQPEINFRFGAALMQKAGLPFEVLAHGPLTAMITDHCLPAALVEGTTQADGCRLSCREKKISLIDEKGQGHPVEVDEDCRNHVFLANELALLPFMKDFIPAGAAGFRLELRTYPPKEVGQVTSLYRKQLDMITADPDNYRFDFKDWINLKKSHNTTYGFGGYMKGVKIRSKDI